MNFLRRLFWKQPIPEPVHQGSLPVYASSGSHVILNIPASDGVWLELKMLPAQARDMAARLLKIADFVESGKS